MGFLQISVRFTLLGKSQIRRSLGVGSSALGVQGAVGLHG